MKTMTTKESRYKNKPCFPIQQKKWYMFVPARGYKAGCGHLNLLTWAQYIVTQVYRCFPSKTSKGEIGWVLFSLLEVERMAFLFQLPSSQFEYCTRIDGKWNNEKRKSMSNKKEKGRFKAILHLGIVGEFSQDLLTLGTSGSQVTNHVEGG